METRVSAWGLASAALVVGALAVGAAPPAPASPATQAPPAAPPGVCDQRRRLGSACPLPLDFVDPVVQPDAPPGSIAPIAR